MEDFRPHLLIPEPEVDYIDPHPVLGPKKQDVDHYEHGSVLSNGLQDIVSAYTKIQSADSLRDEDIRIFEILLPEGEKFSNKTLRDFLEAEGMCIASVHDEHRATVVTTGTRFGTLRERIARYSRGERINKSFRDIQAFRFPDPVEKQAPSIKENFLSAVGAEVLDVEIREVNISEHVGMEGQLKAEKNLITQIQKHGGQLLSKPFVLADNTRMLRAGIAVSGLKEVSGDTLVDHVAPTSFYSTSPAYIVPAAGPLRLNPEVNIEGLPLVVVLDSGVDFPDELAPVIFEHWVPTDAEPGNKDHGTCVASKVAFADVGYQMNLGTLTPRARIIDCNVCGPDPESKRPGEISNPTMLRRITEAVERYKDITKIFNFSSAGKKPIEGDKISTLGFQLDNLSLKYGVQFIISAGNHELFKTEDSLQKILDDDDSRIAAPSDSMLNISVGSIVGQDHRGSLSKKYEVAPYSRIGPGFQGVRKPDLVSLAGTVLSSGNAAPDEYSLMIGHGGKWAIDAGTSFSAPVIAGDLAQISTSVPDGDVFLSKALLYHGSILPLDAGGKTIERDDAAFYGDLYGRGLPQVMDSMYSTRDKVTFLHNGTMNKKHRQRVKFLMPAICDELNMKKRNPKVRVTVTCVTTPPIDYEKGTEYLQAYISTSLYSINSNGNAGNTNPSETDGRKKWDTCFHFSKEYSSFRSGDWDIFLELHTRYDIPEDQDIPYSLAITVEDLTHTLELYDSIVLEAQGRFPVVNMVRVPIRY